MRAAPGNTNLQILEEPWYDTDAPGVSGPPRTPARRLDKRLRACLYLATGLVVAYALGAVLPDNVLSANNMRLSLAWWLDTLRSNVGALALYFVEGRDVASVGISLTQRVMPIVAGAALGISGAVYQGSLRNSLASPSTLGVQAGASLGVTLYALLFVTDSATVTVTSMSDMVARFETLSPLEYLVETQTLALWAVAGALAAAGCVLGVALLAGRGRMSGIALIITGQVLMTLLGAANQLVRYWLAYTAPDSTQSLTMRYLQTSKLGGAFNWVDLIACATPVLIGIVALVALAPRLNLLSLGEDEARTLGVRTGALGIGSVGACTLITAVVVAYCGVIGFVGFFIPHLMRRVVGADLRYLLPASALGGGLFLIVAYDTVCFIDSGLLPGIGIMTSLIGGVVFIAMVIKQRGGSDGWL